MTKDSSSKGMITSRSTTMSIGSYSSLSEGIVVVESITTSVSEGTFESVSIDDQSSDDDDQEPKSQ